MSRPCIGAKPRISNPGKCIMQKTLLTLLGATGLALLSLPNPASAQRASIDDWWEWALPAISHGEPIQVSRGGRITQHANPADLRTVRRALLPR